MKYKVQYNYCSCHPETCACNPYKVVDISTGQEVASFYLKNDAQIFCNILNK